MLDSTLTIWPSPQLISYTRRPSWMNRWMNSSESLADKRTLPSVADVFIVMKMLFDEADDQPRDAYSRNELPLNDGKCTARSVEGQWNSKRGGLYQDVPWIQKFWDIVSLICSHQIFIGTNQWHYNHCLYFIIVLHKDVNTFSMSKLLPRFRVFCDIYQNILSYQILQIIRWARTTCPFLYLSRNFKVYFLCMHP